MTENSKKISELIEELKVNDQEDIYEAEEEPEEPEAISELIKIGRPAVEPLLMLSCAEGVDGNWSAVYAVKILGEIGDLAAIEPLIFRLVVVQGESTFITNEIIEALRKFSLASIETLLHWSKEEGHESPEIYYVLDKIMGDFPFYDDRISNTFIKALSSSSEEIRSVAVRLLARNVPEAENYLKLRLEDTSQKVVDEARQELEKIRIEHARAEEEWEEEEEERPDEWWFEEMGFETVRFLFEVFYPQIGFHYGAESLEAWTRNLKMLFVWDSLRWDREHYRVRNKEPMKKVIDFMLKAVVPKGERWKFSRHINTAKKSLSQGLIFPPETENKLYQYLVDYVYDVETEEEFIDFKESVFKDLGPPPYEFVTILRRRKKI